MNIGYSGWDPAGPWDVAESHDHSMVKEHNDEPLLIAGVGGPTNLR